MSPTRSSALALLCLLLPLTATAAEPLTVDAINAATFSGTEPDGKERDPLVIRLQVMLDRAHMSPGVIDGLWGDNVRKALAAYEEAQGLAADGKLDQEAWDRLAVDTAPVFTTYTVTEEDMKGPFVPDIPKDYAEQAKMERLSFTGPAEMLAERFHMDIKLFNELNPDAATIASGTALTVAAPEGAKLEGKAAKVEIKRGAGILRALGKDGKLIAAFPVSVGSDDVRNPEGTHKVKNVVPNPDYSYRPAVNFQQGQLTENLRLPPGPNGPVGSMWIGLDKPTYGIHGTPEPSPVGKHFSHGCARLTNWDAAALAGLVEPGIEVAFQE